MASLDQLRIPGLRPKGLELRQIKKYQFGLPVLTPEAARLRRNMEQHYSQPKGFVGRSFVYEVWYDDEFYGHIVAGSATYGLPAPADGKTIGLNHIINNTFFHIEPIEGKYPIRNFAVAVLEAFEERAVKDWEAKPFEDGKFYQVYGLETLIEPPRTGEMYRRSGWAQIGSTKGFSVKRGAGPRGPEGEWGGTKIWSSEPGTPKTVLWKAIRDLKTGERLAGVSGVRMVPAKWRPAGAGQHKDIRPGDFVKLLFHVIHKGKKHGERMWVKVQRVSRSTGAGTLDNDSVYSKSYRSGRKVQFKFKDVLQVLRKRDGTVGALPPGRQGMLRDRDTLIQCFNEYAAQEFTFSAAKLKKPQSLPTPLLFLHMDGRVVGQVDLLPIGQSFIQLGALAIDPSERRKGYAYRFLRQLCAFADALGVEISLEPQPFVDSPMTREQLAGELGRMGFRWRLWTGQRTADGPAPWMVRQPSRGGVVGADPDRITPELALYMAQERGLPRIEADDQFDADEALTNRERVARYLEAIPKREDWGGKTKPETERRKKLVRYRYEEANAYLQEQTNAAAWLRYSSQEYRNAMPYIVAHVIYLMPDSVSDAMLLNCVMSHGELNGNRHRSAKLWVDMALAQYEEKYGKLGAIEPLRMFHGTRQPSLAKLEPSRGGEYGPGLYLTPTRATAQFYASVVASGQGEPRVLTVEVDLEPTKIFYVSKQEWLKSCAGKSRTTVQNKIRKKGFEAIWATGLSGSEQQLVLFDATKARIVDDAPSVGALKFPRKLEDAFPLSQTERQGLALLHWVNPELLQKESPWQAVFGLEVLEHPDLIRRALSGMERADIAALACEFVFEHHAASVSPPIQIESMFHAFAVHFAEFCLEAIEAEWQSTRQVPEQVKGLRFAVDLYLSALPGEPSSVDQFRARNRIEDLALWALDKSKADSLSIFKVTAYLGRVIAQLSDRFYYPTWQALVGAMLDATYTPPSSEKMPAVIDRVEAWIKTCLFNVALS